MGDRGGTALGRAADPRGRADAGERRRGDRRRPPLRGRRRERHRGRARRQGSSPDDLLRGGCPRRGEGPGGAGVTVAVEERFGPYGGRYVPEVLIPALDQLTEAWGEARRDPGFRAELDELLRGYVGRPTPLYLATRLSERVDRRVYLKREDLAHTGAHKINNAVGQALLARRMGKRRVIAETGAGQHGVATGTICALFGLKCVIYMGAEDVRRQALNVFRMRLLGAEVITVNAGTRTLKDAINEALRDWVTNVHDTYYLLGSALGPHPYPLMVREFQSVIGREAREQILSGSGKLPRALIACVGGGSNAIGLFHPFIGDESVRLIGVEAGGCGDSLGEHAARFHDGAAR